MIRPALVVAAGSAVLVTAGVTWLAFAAAGPDGLSWSGIAMLALMSAGARLRWTGPPGSSRAERHEDAPTPGGFPRYDQLYSQASWASVERRHYDRVLRPQLWRLVETTIRDRHGAAAAADKDWVRGRLGEAAYRLVDPDRTTWTDPAGQRAPGPSVDDLRRLTDAIEAL